MVYLTTNDDGLYKSTDSGATWATANSGLTSTFLLVVAIDPTDSQVVYVGSADGVFRSTDGGATWSDASLGLTSRILQSLAIDPTDTDTIYAGVYGTGVFFKTQTAGQ